MSVQTYKDLYMHIGHEIEVASYTDYADKSIPHNVAIECLDCSEVLLDFDRE